MSGIYSPVGLVLFYFEELGKLTRFYQIHEKLDCKTYPTAH